jgi:polysaccharide biosynthesis protein PelG
MAGIGFRLKELLVEDTYSSNFKAFLYSAIISSGPWLLTILCLSLLGILSPIFLSQNEWTGEQADLFGVTVVYIFAFSLIVTGPISMLISRFVADKIYFNEQETISSTYATLLLFVVLLQGVLGSVFFSITSKDIFYTVTSLTLYVTISCIWISLIFLSICEKYNNIILIFSIGSLVSVAAALLGGKLFGISGYISGFTIGQLIILFGFTHELFSMFGIPRNMSLDFLSYVRKFFEIALIGLLYNMAIWVDKFTFWFSSPGENISGLFYAYGEYDFPIFLAYITIVPALAIFLLNIETGFYQEYKAFYESIMKKKSFGEIHRRKMKMQATLFRSLRELLNYQAIITIVVIYFGKEILHGLQVESLLSIQIFRYTALGTFFHAYVLIITIILLYFDLRREVLIIVFIFAGSNFLLTTLSIHLGPDYYGLGQAVSCFLTFLISFVVLIIRLRQLEFLTFSKQPIAGSKKDTKERRARPGGGYGAYVNLQEAREAFRSGK